ncbi:MAG: heme NO-binding domain-containing protein [Gammaproteobacteria bacterium]|nr:heme NO-binding domain-containing protein [Gammaproteobacteria bacterium]MBU1724474.1 heme NO-binding domain-containing protein [Gammaproteobacteria bacterium]
MKGLVFTEFLEMVESRFSPAMVDDIIDDADLPSDGAYTSVGTYPHSEMLALVESLSKNLNVAIPELIRLFGHHLFHSYVMHHSTLFEGKQDVFDFLEQLEHLHRIEVHKLYPDAVFPTFRAIRTEKYKLLLTYQSHRPFAQLAKGLIEGCLEYYQVEAKIETIDHSAGKGTHVDFHITRTDME